ncbi:MAG TPA: site-specific integrase [Firmicutes bacterium]|nr:site-specific integrase [Bacillota bacterium]
MKTMAEEKRNPEKGWEKPEEGMPMTEQQIGAFLEACRGKGRQSGTIDSYRRSLTALYQALPGEKRLDRAALDAWREELRRAGDSPRTVNAKLSAVNSFLGYCGRKDLRQELERVPADEVQPELTRVEYLRLLQAAKQGGKERTYLLMKVICCMGMALQDIPRMTVEDVRAGTAASGEGRVYIPEALCRELLEYARRKGLASGPLFVTRRGGPMDRISVNRSIKGLCRAAQVAEEKGTPLCLRKLHQSTYAGIRENMDVLVEQAYARLLEKEELTIGWRV